MASVTALAPMVGVTAACQAVGVAPASFYRHARRQVGCSADLLRASLRHEGAAGERSEQILPCQGSDRGVGEPSPAPSASSSRPVLTRGHARALSVAEQQAVVDALHAPRFRDAAPATV